MKLGGLIGFILGAAAGSGITYILTKKADNKKNDEEIAKLEAYFKDKIVKRPIEAKQVKEAPAAEEAPSEEAKKLETAKLETSAIKNVKGPVTDYAGQYKMRREEDPDPIPEGNKPYLDTDVEAQMASEIKGMVIITGEEYDQDNGYSKDEISYYEPDEIFTDQYGNEIGYLSPDDFGRANLEHFGMTGEEGVLYCRDDDNMADYKINLEEGSFYEVME